MTQSLTSPSADEAFDGDRAEHRAALISLLQAEGLKAYEYHSGGGLFHVCVDLLNETDPDWLAIATGETDGPAIGLMGERDGHQVESGFDDAPKTFGDMTARFQAFWNERENWIAMFRASALDL